MYLLLAGYPPFDGDSHDEIFNSIMFADLRFNEKHWSHVSADARDLVRAMLCKDPHQRITAHDALANSWLNDNIEHQLCESQVMHKTVANFLGFHAETKFQQAVY
jgi:serine/threonine protein kinase